LTSKKLDYEMVVV